jgi:hypothetical protein
METGQRGATLRDVRDLCDLYGVTDPAQRDHMMALAKESKQQGWWQSFDLPYSTYVGLETEAVSIKDYDSTIVPGLLQTASYARALHQAAVPSFTNEVIEQRVAERRTRQQLLLQHQPPRFWTVIDEAVLHRVVGGPVVMRAQLERIVEVAKMPNVTIQVVPYAVGAHPALDSTFTILDFASSLNSVVYVEGLVGWIYLERPEDLGRYYRVFDRLCAMALSPQDTRDMVASICGALKGSW